MFLLMKKLKNMRFKFHHNQPVLYRVNHNQIYIMFSNHLKASSNMISQPRLAELLLPMM